jgi:hypothetical protein
VSAVEVREYEVTPKRGSRSVPMLVLASDRAGAIQVAKERIEQEYGSARGWRIRRPTPTSRTMVVADPQDEETWRR